MGHIQIFIYILIIAISSSLICARPQATSVDTVPQAPPTVEGNEWQQAWQNIRAAFGNVGNWFVRQYRGVQNWFATSRQELERKVQDMVNFLGTVKDNMNALAQVPGQQLQLGLQNVNNFYNDVVTFQQKLRTDAAASFQTLENEWQTKVRTMYNGGLDKIVDAANQAKMEVKQQEPQPQIQVAMTNNTG